MIASSLLILCLASIAESRVSFPFSEVLQRNDLLGGLTTFQCYAGCRVYSPNANDEIIILDKTGRVYYSLKQLSELKPGEYNDLPARPDPYTLKKTAADQGKDFVFYVIEKGAKNYDTRVYYVIDEETRTQAFREPLFTVLSTTGAIYMNFYGGTFEEGCPTVYATGFDSFSVCRPVYTARSAESVLNTAFPIYSPIATVDFKDSWGTKVSDVSGNPNGVITRGLNTTSVFTSPGYVGCGIDANTGGPARYYFDNNLIGFDSSFTVQSDYGMSVHITGDYSITTVNDEVTLTVNDIEETLNGTNHAYSLSYEPQFKRSPVQIGLKWQKQPFTQDSFAIQIDVIDKAPVIATTTTRPAQIIQTTVAPRSDTKSQPGNLITTTEKSAVDVNTKTTTAPIVDAKATIDTTSTVDTKASTDDIQTTSRSAETEETITTSGEHEITTSSSAHIFTGSILMVTNCLLIVKW